MHKTKLPSFKIPQKSLKLLINLTTKFYMYIYYQEFHRMYYICYIINKRLHYYLRNSYENYQKYSKSFKIIVANTHTFYRPMFSM